MSQWSDPLVLHLIVEQGSEIEIQKKDISHRSEYPIVLALDFMK